MNTKVFTKEIVIMVSQIVSMHICQIQNEEEDCYVRIIMTNGEVYRILCNTNSERALHEARNILEEAMNEIRAGRQYLSLPAKTEYDYSVYVVEQICCP